MSDLISRDELLRYVNDRIGKIKEIRDSAKEHGEADVFAHCNGEITEARGMKHYLNMFAPAVDAVPVVHAKWVKAHGMMPPEYHHRKQCSMCGGWALQDYFGRELMSHYCPNCGAKMGEEVIE